MKSASGARRRAWFDRLERPPLLDLCIHLRQGIFALDDASPFDKPRRVGATVARVENGNSD